MANWFVSKSIQLIHINNIFTNLSRRSISYLKDRRHYNSPSLLIFIETKILGLTYLTYICFSILSWRWYSLQKYQKNYCLKTFIHVSFNKLVRNSHDKKEFSIHSPFYPASNLSYFLISVCFFIDFNTMMLSISFLSFHLTDEYNSLLSSLIHHNLNSFSRHPVANLQDLVISEPRSRPQYTVFIVSKSAASRAVICGTFSFES